MADLQGPPPTINRSNFQWAGPAGRAFHVPQPHPLHAHTSSTFLPSSSWAIGNLGIASFSHADPGFLIQPTEGPGTWAGSWRKGMNGLDEEARASLWKWAQKANCSSAVTQQWVVEITQELVDSRGPMDIWWVNEWVNKQVREGRFLAKSTRDQLWLIGSRKAFY